MIENREKKMKNKNSITSTGTNIIKFSNGKLRFQLDLLELKTRRSSSAKQSNSEIYRGLSLKMRTSLMKFPMWVRGTCVGLLSFPKIEFTTVTEGSIESQSLENFFQSTDSFPGTGLPLSCYFKLQMEHLFSIFGVL